ncbi:hypothetical protein BGZ54_008816, partial [Gamsiella multidivaricata]
GKMVDLWAKVEMLKNRSKGMGNRRGCEVSWIPPNQLEAITKTLHDTQLGLAYLQNLLKDDTQTLEILSHKTHKIMQMSS